MNATNSSAVLDDLTLDSFKLYGLIATIAAAILLTLLALYRQRTQQTGRRNHVSETGKLIN